MANGKKDQSGSEVTVTGPNGEEHKISDISPKLVEAIFREATAKTEQKSGTLHEPYDIHERDIIELSHKMEQTVRTFQQRGYEFTFYLKTEDEKIDRLNSIASLTNFDKSQTKPTS